MVMLAAGEEGARGGRHAQCCHLKLGRHWCDCSTLQRVERSAGNCRHCGCTRKHASHSVAQGMVGRAAAARVPASSLPAAKLRASEYQVSNISPHASLRVRGSERWRRARVASTQPGRTWQRTDPVRTENALQCRRCAVSFGFRVCVTVRTPSLLEQCNEITNEQKWRPRLRPGAQTHDWTAITNKRARLAPGWNVLVTRSA